MKKLLTLLKDSKKLDEDTYNQLLADYEKIDSELSTLRVANESFSLQVDSLEVEIKKADKGNNDELKEELRRTKSELISTKTENELTNVLSKYDLVSYEVVKMALNSKTNYEGGLILFDGKELIAGVRDFFNGHPELLKPIGKTGSGAEVMRSNSQTLTQKLLNK